MLKKLLVWHCRPGCSQGGSVDRIFFFFLLKKLEVSASNPFEMQAKLYAELTDDISDTTVFLRIACSNAKLLCRNRYLKQ